VAISALMLALMRYQRSPVALVAVLVGIGVGQILGIAPPFPTPDFGPHLPHLVIPTWVQILNGTEYAVLPQIPQRNHCDGGGVTTAIPEGVASGQRAEPCRHDRIGQSPGCTVRGLPDVPRCRRHCRPLSVRRAHSDRGHG